MRKAVYFATLAVVALTLVLVCLVHCYSLSTMLMSLAVEHRLAAPLRLVNAFTTIHEHGLIFIYSGSSSNPMKSSTRPSQPPMASQSAAN